MKSIREGENGIAPSHTLPWPRILARGIDTLIYLSIIYCCYPLLGALLDDLIYKNFGESGGFLFFWSCWIALRLCLFLFYEIFFLSLLSSTPGKAILGLSVVEHDGSKLSFSSAVSRAIRVCGYLFLFFIPYVSLLLPISCLAHLYYYKTKAGKFIWDRNDRWMVTGEKKIPIAYKFTGALCLALCLVLIILIILSFPNAQALKRFISMVYKIYVF